MKLNSRTQGHVPAEMPAWSVSWSKYAENVAPLLPNAADTSCGAGRAALTLMICTAVESEPYSVLPDTPNRTTTVPLTSGDATM